MKLLLAFAFVLTGCAYHSPGAKVSTVITVNASLTPATQPLLP